MRLFSITFFLITTFSLAFGQKAENVLAIANGKNFSAADLSPQSQQLLVNQSQIYTNARSQLLSKIIADNLIEMEAKAKGVTSESLVAAEKAKVANPTDAQINIVFEANREALSDKSPAEARKQVIEFLRQDPEQAAMKKYVDALIAKYKPLKGKDINAGDLRPQDVILSIGTRSVTAKDFEDKYKLVLYSVRADIIDQVKVDLENTIYESLVAVEAKTLEIDSGELIAREITNKMKDFSDEERAALEEGFKSRLFTKYNAKVLLKYPPPIVQNISVESAPSRGTATAPVTVVMFSDFQCPACSATHPVLQKVLAEYGDKIRFVVRDFPLTSLHANAYRAALAAYAANQQGKFFEYTDILYKNQKALDDASLSKYAASLGLNVKRFELDLSSENAAAAVKKDMADSVSYGITGTPTIFVNGIMVRHLSAGGFREAINDALNKK